MFASSVPAGALPDMTRARGSSARRTAARGLPRAPVCDTASKYHSPVAVSRAARDRNSRTTRPAAPRPSAAAPRRPRCTEVAHPATTGEGTVFSGHAEAAEVTVEHVVQRARCRPDRHGLGGDHVRAAGPRAAQGDRMRVIPHEPQHVGRGEVPPQWSARDKRSRSRHSQIPHSGHSQRLTGHDGHAP